MYQNKSVFSFFIFGVLFAKLCFAQEPNKPAAEKKLAPLSSQGILDDIMATTDQKMIYDWQKSNFELEAGYGSTDEQNNFETEVFNLGVGIPLDNNKIRFGLRRVNVSSTSSSHMLARTPFRQAATMTRYEIYGLFDFTLMEGRSISRLSGIFMDFEQLITLPIGLHYSHPNKSLIPKKSDRPEPLPGQDQVNSILNFDIGLRWLVYFPNHFGLYCDWSRQFRRASAKELGNWSYYSLGVVWNFAP